MSHLLIKFLKTQIKLGKIRIISLIILLYFLFLYKDCNIHLIKNYVNCQRWKINDTEKWKSNSSKRDHASKRAQKTYGFILASHIKAAV